MKESEAVGGERDWSHDDGFRAIDKDFGTTQHVTPSTPFFILCPCSTSSYTYTYTKTTLSKQSQSRY